MKAYLTVTLAFLAKLFLFINKKSSSFLLIHVFRLHHCYLHSPVIQLFNETYLLMKAV